MLLQLINLLRFCIKFLLINRPFIGYIMNVISFLLLLASSVSNDFPEGDWVPLYYQENGQLDCHQRFFDQPFVLSFKGGALATNICNEIDYYYCIEENSLLLERVSEEQTLIGCTGLSEKIEERLVSKSIIAFEQFKDTLVLKFEHSTRLKLIRKERFNSTWYNDYYNGIGCKWPYKQEAQLSEFLNNEPVYIGPEEMPKLCGNMTAQEIADQNLRRMSWMDNQDFHEQVIIHLLIDKSGQVNSFRPVKLNKDVIEKEVNRLLKYMPVWEPGKIDNQPVNSYFPLILKF